MKKNVKGNRIAVLALAAVTAVGVIAGTFAYFSQTSSFTNIFKTGTYSTTIKEEFTPPTNWTPGTTTNKKVTVANTGTVDVLVRAQLAETWKAGDTTLPLVLTDAQGNEIKDANGNTIETVIKNLNDVVEFTTPVFDFAANAGKWIHVGDYYYYNAIVKAGAESNALLNSVTLNSAVKATVTSDDTTTRGVVVGEIITKAEFDTLDETSKGYFDVVEGTETYEATVAGTITTTTTITSNKYGYDGATYTLTVTAQTVQATKDAAVDFFAITDDDAGINDLFIVMFLAYLQINA